jgi:hypothetical protein
MYRHLWTAGKIQAADDYHNMGRRKTMNIIKKAGTEPTRNTRQIEA